MRTLDALEIRVGKLQYEAMCWALMRISRVRECAVDLDGLHVPYFDRPARPRAHTGPSAGAGEPIILVHGFAADKETWLMMTPFLSRGRRVLIPDLPGFGAATPVPPARATARAQAAMLHTWIDVMGFDRVHVVGNSMGGAIAMRMAHDFPERVASMVLLAPAWKDVTISELGEGLEQGRNLLIPEAIDDLDSLMQMVAENPPPAPRALQRYAAYARYQQRHRLHELFSEWHEGNREAGVPYEVAHIEVPALILHGERDRVIHVDVGRALAEQLPNSELIVLDGVGHVPQLEVPRRTAQIIDGFLDRA